MIIKYTETALNDIDSIFDYIAYSLLEPETAKAQVDSIVKAIRTLDEMPGRYRLYEDEPWHSKGLRVLTVKKYLVFYLPVSSENTVYIIRVMYGGRNIKNLLEETS